MLYFSIKLIDVFVSFVCVNALIAFHIVLTAKIDAHTDWPWYVFFIFVGIFIYFFLYYLFLLIFYFFIFLFSHLIFGLISHFIKRPVVFIPLWVGICFFMIFMGYLLLRTHRSNVGAILWIIGGVLLFMLFNILNLI